MSDPHVHVVPNPSREHIRSLIRSLSVRVVPPGEEFTLSSGERSRVYCDLKKSALLGEAAGPLASLIVDASLDLAPETGSFAYAGVALGGCHLASIAAFYSGSDAIHVRKEAKGHGTKKLVEAPSCPPGTPVVLVEDVTTTANSALKALEALREEGFSVIGIVTVVDRRNAWKSQPPEQTVGGVPIRSIFRIEELCDGEPEYSALQEAADHGSPF